MIVNLKISSGSLLTVNTFYTHSNNLFGSLYLATFMNAISQLQKMWTYHVTQLSKSFDDHVTVCSPAVGQQ